LQATRDHHEMMGFSIGEKVSLEPPGRGKLTDILMKYNKKTVTVITDQGQRWNVSPYVLSKVVEQKNNSSKKDNVLQLKKKVNKSSLP